MCSACTKPGWAKAREFIWGDSGRFPEVVAMVDYTGAGLSVSNACGTGATTQPAEACGGGTASQGCVYHYLHDALGSIIGLTDCGGHIVERYTYDPYGKTFVEKWDPAASGGAGAWVANGAAAIGGYSGSTTPTYSAFGNPWMWTGQRYDAAASLYHFHFRTYSPALGRWLQRDPAGYVDGVNLYEAALSSPTRWTDPLGLDVKLSNGDRWWRAIKGIAKIGVGVVLVAHGIGGGPILGPLGVYLGIGAAMDGYVDILAALTGNDVQLKGAIDLVIERVFDEKGRLVSALIRAGVGSPSVTVTEAIIKLIEILIICGDMVENQNRRNEGTEPVPVIRVEVRDSLGRVYEVTVAGPARPVIQPSRPHAVANRPLYLEGQSPLSPNADKRVRANRPVVLDPAIYDPEFSPGKGLNLCKS